MSKKNTFSELAINRYALALYEVAKEKSVIEQVEEESNSILELLKVNTEFKSLVQDPTNKMNEQLSAIKLMAEKFNFSLIFSKFLGFLVSKRRFFFLEKILKFFLTICSKNRGEILAKLNSSKELSETEVEEMQKELSKNFTSKVKLDYKHEPSLIGGLIIQIESVMIDTSIKNKLNRLEIQMVEG